VIKKPVFVLIAMDSQLVRFVTYALKVITAIRPEEYLVDHVHVQQWPIHSVTRVNSEELMITFVPTVEKDIQESTAKFVQMAIGVIRWVREAFVCRAVAGNVSK